MTWQAEHDFADFRFGETDVASADYEQAIMAVLPSSDELRARFVSALRVASPHVELVAAKRSHYRLWLESDIDGPGYSRQKVYGVIRMDGETPLMLQDGQRSARVAAHMQADAYEVIGALARLVAERVSTFRAYNNLRSTDVVTVRAFDSLLLRYLATYGTDGCVKADPATDVLMVRLGGYFFVCPPGDEHVPTETP